MAENDMVVHQNNTAIVAGGFDFGDDAGSGFENQTTADRSIPFLNVTQTGTPQTKKKDPTYIEGLEPGDLFIPVLAKTWKGDKGCILVPCYTEHVYVEWIPRTEGGGFVAKHAVDSPVVRKAISEAKDRKLKVGKNELIETFYMYAMAYDDKTTLPEARSCVADLIDLNGSGIPVVIPLTSTKISAYKKIMTQLSLFKIPNVPFPRNTPPLWAFPLRFTTVYETREQGDSFNAKFEFALGDTIDVTKLVPRFNADKTETSVYAEAKRFKEAVSLGSVKVDYNAAGGGASGAAPSGSENANGDIPF